MRYATSFCITAVLIALFVLPAKAGKLAGDMDDGIGIDDGFTHGDELKKKPNIAFKKVKAQAEAERAKEDAKNGITSDDSAAISGGKGDVNIGSANVGGSVFGDVIIIMNGMKNATVVK